MAQARPLRTEIQWPRRLLGTQAGLFGLIPEASMLPILTVSETRALDEMAVRKIGIPVLALMEVAGFGSWQVLQRMPWNLGGQARVLVLAGKGHNGGDGFVLARYLAVSGQVPRILCCFGPQNVDQQGPAWDNSQLLPAFGVNVEAMDDQNLAPALEECDVVVDALLGTGLRAQVREPLLATINELNARSLPVLSLDMPSGLCGDTGQILGAAVQARCTVTYGALKSGLVVGQGPRLAGEIALVPLPFPPAGLEKIRLERG